MKCINCGRGSLAPKDAIVEGQIRGEVYGVSTPALDCDKCGHSVLEGDAVQEHLRRLSDAYRSAHGLLTSQEIRNRRLALNMSQAEFARYLRVGIASIKRWELGAIQEELADEYLRLKTDPREAHRNAREVESLTLSRSGTTWKEGAEDAGWDRAADLGHAYVA